MDSRAWDLRQGFSAKGILPVAGMAQQTKLFRPLWQIGIIPFWQNENDILAISKLMDKLAVSFDAGKVLA